ncbi:unnamed protein product [Spirodela intermedia]|uniref:RING-type E3 ubiquitin transferase n=1 Tax=Spirodela intermedia TaxID=51605 RepID=A0A7I8IG94_SPIIN|nr:unnamed protein product [Spirodela intermedia]CAA6656801.1 unnamed protein product [Spirodela intermedia]
MSFVFRGARGEIGGEFSRFLRERRAARLHDGGHPVSANSRVFLLTVLLLFVVLNSTRFIWLLLSAFLMATAIRMCAACQQLHAQAQAHAAVAAGGLLGHAELRLQMPPAAAFAASGRHQGLRLQLALLDRDFDDLDYDALRALDAGSNAAAPSMTEEEIDALPGGASLQRAAPSSSASSSSSSPSLVAEKEHDAAKSERDRRSPADELTCSVCLEQVYAGELVRILPCLHQFHVACIDPWLRQQGTCPVCKYRAARRWQDSSGSSEADPSFMV